ncbi:hypothetical protein Scep_030940 [Stephania cephalantha]|uniref:Uncharacterized protein n=1 Tax=Stephania cephalantha TaxID=152367 RepID=A0AAP0E0L0_9MAGN
MSDGAQIGDDGTWTRVGGRSQIGDGQQLSEDGGYRGGEAAAGRGRRTAARSAARRSGRPAVQRCSSDAADWRGADGQRPSSSGGVAARADQPRIRSAPAAAPGNPAARRRRWTAAASGGAPAKAVRQRQRRLRRGKLCGGALSTGRMHDFDEIATTRWR